jgi:hypothetical protein
MTSLVLYAVRMLRQRRKAAFFCEDGTSGLRQGCFLQTKPDFYLFALVLGQTRKYYRIK